jgi:hypothetical protein
MKTNNQEPCDCAFCVQEKKITELRLKGSLTRIQEQLEQSRKKREDYEKTTKLLNLTNRNNT